eukprot:1681315-Amphidinium_carterae.1
MQLVDDVFKQGHGDCVNAVVYGSLFKGSAMYQNQSRRQSFQAARGHEEASFGDCTIGLLVLWHNSLCLLRHAASCSRGVEPKIETWNALIGAYSVCGTRASCNRIVCSASNCHSRMVDRVPQLMKEMHAGGHHKQFCSQSGSRAVECAGVVPN